MSYICIKSNTMKKLITLLLVFISLIGYSQKVTDTIRVESFNKEFYDSLIFAKMIEFAPKKGLKLYWSPTDYIINPGFKLVRHDLLDKEVDYISKLYIQNNYKLPKGAVALEMGRFVGPLIYNKEPHIRGALSPDGYLCARGYTTYDRITTARAEEYVRRMLESGYVKKDEVIYFSFSSIQFNWDLERKKCNEINFALYVVPRDI